ncbi:MAG TPA: hypothetical protein VFL47_01965, partial [Flavisolibacter sp.]|nr:hypothetical protein [Flavisolibacter sp.]
LLLTPNRGVPGKAGFALTVQKRINDKERVHLLRFYPPQSMLPASCCVNVNSNRRPVILLRDLLEQSQRIDQFTSEGRHFKGFQ